MNVSNNLAVAARSLEASPADPTATPDAPRQCTVCGQSCAAMYCSKACKQKAWRQRQPPNGWHPTVEPRDLSGWQPVDLVRVLNDDHAALVPTMLGTTGGVRLLYPGMTHTAFGETESLKTWLALIAVTQEIQAGNHVLVIDYENDARTVVQRRLHQLLRVPIDDLVERLRYVQASDPVSRGTLEPLIAPPTPSLCVIDGLTEAMAIEGLNPNDGSDVARFYATLPRQITQSGCAVVTLDHVVKDRDAQGLYPVSSAHKLNAIEGAAYRLKLVTAPSAEHAGSARIYVAKDRNGEVRRHQASDKQIATLHIDANVAGWRLDAPSAGSAGAGGGDEFRPTVLMARASEYLAEKSVPVSQAQVLRDVRGNAKWMRDALRALARDGYARQTDGLRNALMFEHVKPFEDSP